MRISAADKQSGVVRLEVSPNPTQPGKGLSVPRTKKLTKTVTFQNVSALAYVRAEDAGGNFTKWRKARVVRRPRHSRG